MDPSVGHFFGILARIGGILNKNVQTSQMPGVLPGRDVEASNWPLHYLAMFLLTHLMASI